jgi:manganese/zinc/iron transport system ATP- binding protein
MPSVAIEAHELTVSYHTAKPVIWNIDFAVPSGKIIGIIGPNGAGKSTLLKAIMGLVPISSGWVKIFDHPLAAVRNQVSYVPQRESVDWDFPANVLDVVLTGRYPARGCLTALPAPTAKLPCRASKK